MKASIVVDRELPIGLIANCAAVLGVSLGMLHPEIVGPNLTDKSGVEHQGITGLPIPILAADRATLRELVRTAGIGRDVKAIPFSDVAQKCVDYDDYSAQLGMTDFDSLNFLGVLLVGPSKVIRSLTGSMPLLR